MMQLSHICEQVNGQMQGADVFVRDVSINTREDCDNRLFVALKGDNFDAHDFVEEAAKAGAGAVMVERDVPTDLPSVTVADTHQALKDLAAWWRSQFVIPVVGVTGSVGKTTVKEMLRAIFSGVGKGVVTAGNLNNEIGVPLTLMHLTPQDRYAIIEMGMNQAGEISRLTKMTKPTVALVNNAAAAHLEGLGSIEAVANAKGEIFSGLSADGVAIINHDDTYADLWKRLATSRRVITFGLSSGADVTAQYREEQDTIVLDVSAPEENFSVTIKALGQHSVTNALAAISVALAANVPVDVIQAGLTRYKAARGRLNILRVAGITIIDDTYNANPASMEAAIKVLVKHDDSTLIVGDMAELGDAAEHEHKALGAMAKSLGVSTLYACGEFAHLVADSFGTGANAFSEQADLLMHLAKHPPANTTLVKGSRSAHMENVVTALCEQSKHPSSSSTLSHMGSA